MLFREVRSFRFRQDFEQRNFERRQRQRAIKSVAAAFPLPGNTRMAKQERCDKVGLVAIRRGVVAVAGKVSEQGLGHFGIQVRSHAQPQDGWCYRHIEQLDPDFHVSSIAGHLCSLDGLRRGSEGVGISPPR